MSSLGAEPPILVSVGFGPPRRQQIRKLWPDAEALPLGPHHEAVLPNRRLLSRQHGGGMEGRESARAAFLHHERPITQSIERASEIMMLLELILPQRLDGVEINLLNIQTNHWGIPEGKISRIATCQCIHRLISNVTQITNSTLQASKLCPCSVEDPARAQPRHDIVVNCCTQQAHAIHAHVKCQGLAEAPGMASIQLCSEFIYDYHLGRWVFCREAGSETSSQVSAPLLTPRQAAKPGQPTISRQLARIQDLFGHVSAVAGSRHVREDSDTLTRLLAIIN
mmetsp:Transcript_23375/g.42639  ORF Transcript_23375/g.42639 Transcript_23375/m.42639 type:complete len:281 (+) Transcript_23375:1408-2250(+)